MSKQECAIQHQALKEALEHVYLVATQFWGMNPANESCLAEAVRALKQAGTKFQS